MLLDIFLLYFWFLFLFYNNILPSLCIPDYYTNDFEIFLEFTFQLDGIHRGRTGRKIL